MAFHVTRGDSMSGALDHVWVEGYPAVRVVAPGRELSATVVPSLAMLGCSLRHRGEELLGQRGGVRSYAERGSTMGVPLLYPWANRLSDLRAAGVALDPDSDLLRMDASTGLPIHGLRLRGAGWEVETCVDGAGVSGALDVGADRAGGRLSASPSPEGGVPAKMTVGCP